MKRPEVRTHMVIWKRLRRFWDKDDSLSVFLVLLLLFVFVIGPLSASDPRIRFLTGLGFGFVLISGIWATFESLYVARLAATFALFAVFTTVIEGFYLDSLRFQIFSKFCDIPVLILFLYVLLKQTMKDGPVSKHRVKGGIAIYLLIGVLWAQLYHLLFLVSPEAFSGVDGTNPFPSLIYYSFVTLTTVGYGDILPVQIVGRSLATFEAFIGQLFPAIFIARLVGAELQSRIQ